MTWLREQLEAIASEPAPSRRGPSVMPFLPRTDLPRRARVFVTDDDSFDETLAAMVAELADDRRPRMRVVPLEPLRSGWRTETTWAGIR